MAVSYTDKGLTFQVLFKDKLEGSHVHTLYKKQSKALLHTRLILCLAGVSPSVSEVNIGKFQCGHTVLKGNLVVLIVFQYFLIFYP